ncbi:hypothetical protein F5H01DRAFT_339055 [Linnemannia elongata]|nr:hypothetical protein F5H01DRAFT_339055 [Linnemannia elongata]
MAPSSPTHDTSIETSSAMVRKDNALMIPEIVSLIGSYLPLFNRRWEARRHRFVDIWNPKPLLRAGAVCRLWHNVLTTVLWHTYDLAIMEKKVPLDVLARNIKLVRNLSLLDMRHRKHTALWEALVEHAHIDRLEIHDSVFSVKKLIGVRDHTLAALKLSGNCDRIHPFLLLFVERQVHLQSLELTRFQFTASDWKKIITNKPHLRKLTISEQCEFLDHMTFDDSEVDNMDDTKDVKMGDKAEAKDWKGDKKPTPSNNNNNSSRTTTSGSAMTCRRKNRLKLVAKALPDARDLGILPITHLVLRDSRLQHPFQKAILEVCPHLEQLEICYSQRADGGEIATLVRENCSKIRRLTLHSNRQPWTLAMIDGMPQAVEELILYTGQLDLQMAMAIKERKNSLTRLELDFGQGYKGKRRLDCILGILLECTELREFAYHNHAEDEIFKTMLFANPWNLPHLRKLRLHGVSPRAACYGIPQVSTPEGWRQKFEGRKHDCCSYRSFEDVRKQGKDVKSPLFDVALLKHIKDLPMLTEVNITETVYRKKLF